MENIIIVGPFVGETGWEIFRFVPYIRYLKFIKYKNQNIKFIIYTRSDRFDLYGDIADIFVSLNIKNDTDYQQDCFRLTGFSEENYKILINNIKNYFNKKYNIIEHIYPDISQRKYTIRWQFPNDKMIWEYNARIENLKILNKYKIFNKPIITLAPRYRNNMKRNWPYWNKLYDLLYDDKILINKYNFVIVGKYPDYIYDKKNRFFDINNITINDNISLIGLSIEILKKSILTIGSQSAIPNLSMLLGTPVLEWGHEKILHSKEYNVKNVKIFFIDDIKYDISELEIYKNIKKII